MNIDERDRVLMALTVYGEARGQPRPGRAAVAWTILHRAANPRWWGRNAGGCCLSPWQYSCWNRNDPNRARLLSFLRDGDTVRPQLTEAAKRDVTLRECVEIVDAICRGEIADPTDGATHYYNPSAVAAPFWSAGRRPSARVGDHLFYAGVEPGTRPAALPPPPDPAAATADPSPPRKAGFFVG